MGLFDCIPCGGGGAPPIPRLRLHVDADRDGVVDNIYQGIDAWRWGVGHRGAVILCNNDDDNNARPIPALGGGGRADNPENPTVGLDHHNLFIDPNDAPDIAPLEIRRHPAGTPFPAGWSARLSVSAANANRIRIFNGQAAGAAAIIGPLTGRIHNIPNLAALPAVLQYGMEAVAYAGPGFDGLIDIKLLVLDPGNAVQQTHRARVRVAPWMAANNMNRVNRLFMMQSAPGDPPNVLAEQPASRAGVVAAAGPAGVGVITQVDGHRYNSDRWMRDIMKIGFASMPRPGAPGLGWHNNAILRTACERGMKCVDKYPWRELVGPDMGFVSPRYPFANPTTRNSFGNLECSPPVPGYPFGRIIYGINGNSANEQMDSRVVDFLAAQRVQKPFWIDTSWLNVGHVDEVLCFLPMPTAPLGFKILIASPSEAVGLLQAAQANGDGHVPTFELPGPPMPTGPRHHPAWNANDYPHADIDAILNDPNLMALQNRIQGLMDTTRDRVRDKLGLTNADFIHFPVLIREIIVAGVSDGCVTYFPDVVNMVVITQPGGVTHLCIPKPFGPIVGGSCIFETDIVQKLQTDYSPLAGAAGMGRIHFIDDFFGYHECRGELHCGTNEVREPVTNAWWWEMNL